MRTPYAVRLVTPDCQQSWPCESELVATARVTSLLVLDPWAEVSEGIQIDEETSQILRTIEITSTAIEVKP